MISAILDSQKIFNTLENKKITIKINNLPQISLSQSDY